MNKRKNEKRFAQKNIFLFFFLTKFFFTKYTEEDHEDNLTNIGQTKTSVGVCRYVYYGKHSEGNRFILNDDL